MASQQQQQQQEEAETTPSLYFEKGTLVVVNGLQSDAGKILNGGQAVVLRSGKKNSGPSPEDERYAVRIFATVHGDELKVLYPPLDRKIKTENLQRGPDLPPDKIATEDDLFMQAAGLYVMKLEAQYRANPTTTTIVDDIVFWLETHHKLRPNSYSMSITYSSVLRDEKRQIKKAAEVLWETWNRNKENIRADRRFCMMCRDFAYTFGDARVHIDTALELALEIPTDSNPNRDIRKELLNHISRVCSEIVAENRGLCGTESFSKMNVDAARAIFEMDKSDAQAAYVLAACCGMAGEHVECIRYYRHALRLGYPNNTNIRVALVEAQLHYPGQPMHNFHLLSVEGNVITAVHNRDKDHFGPAPRGIEGVQCIKSGAETIRFERPTDDPDDENVFGSILEEIRSLTVE